MFPSYSSSSHERLWSLSNRRLLMHNDATSTTDSTPQSKTTSNNGFDANVVMLLSVLLCAIICSLAINFIVKCAFGCSIFSSRNPSQNESENGNHRVSATRLANTGVKKAALKRFPTISYKADLNITGLDTECVICLSEFVIGERVRLLPKCNHGFHARCIDKWLRAHSSCPTCRHCLIETCQKIVGCTLATSSHETIVVTMASLAPEDMIRN